jgi:hypothetical protein
MRTPASKYFESIPFWDSSTFYSDPFAKRPEESDAKWKLVIDRGQPRHRRDQHVPAADREGVEEAEERLRPGTGMDTSQPLLIYLILSYGAGAASEMTHALGEIPGSQSTLYGFRSSVTNF